VTVYFAVCCPTIAWVEAIAIKRPYRAGGAGSEESNLIRSQLSLKLMSVNFWGRFVHPLVLFHLWCLVKTASLSGRIWCWWRSSINF